MGSINSLELDFGYCLMHAQMESIWMRPNGYRGYELGYMDMRERLAITALGTR